MLARLSTALHRAATPVTLAGAIALYVFFLVTVMPGQAAQSRSYAGAWGAPDRHLWYTPDEFYRQVAVWGETGRNDYVSFRLGLDIVWAFAYTAFLLTATSLALRRAFPACDRRRLLNLAALPPMLCDCAKTRLASCSSSITRCV